MKISIFLSLPHLQTDHPDSNSTAYSWRFDAHLDPIVAGILRGTFWLGSVKNLLRTVLCMSKIMPSLYSSAMLP